MTKILLSTSHIFAFLCLLPEMSSPLPELFLQVVKREDRSWSLQELFEDLDSQVWTKREGEKDKERETEREKKKKKDEKCQGHGGGDR